MTAGAARQPAGVAVAPDDGTVYVAGTTTTFGAGFQDAFVLHLVPTGKKLLDAVTWGGTGFEEGSGVGVIAGTVVLSATTTNPPPYSLLDASAKLSAAKGTLAAVAGVLAQPAGISADPAAGTATPTGSYDLRRKLRGGPRQNRSVTFSGPQVVQAPGSDDLEVKGSLAAIIRGSDDIFS